MKKTLVVVILLIQGPTEHKIHVIQLVSLSEGGASDADKMKTLP